MTVPYPPPPARTQTQLEYSIRRLGRRVVTGWVLTAIWVVLALFGILATNIGPTIFWAMLLFLGATVAATLITRTNRKVKQVQLAAYPDQES